jgi:hypothetical protein
MDIVFEVAAAIDHAIPVSDDMTGLGKLRQSETWYQALVQIDAVGTEMQAAGPEQRCLVNRPTYLIEPVACTPASGWEKGQVENQVGLVRERFFTPRLRVKSYDELNGLLLDRCIAYAKAHRHPELRDQTIWQVFEAERPSLVPYAGPFDGFHAVPASVSKTCLVRFDNNRYSVAASAIGRPVEIRA